MRNSKASNQAEIKSAGCAPQLQQPQAEFNACHFLQNHHFTISVSSFSSWRTWQIAHFPLKTSINSRQAASLPVEAETIHICSVPSFHFQKNMWNYTQPGKRISTLCPAAFAGVDSVTFTYLQHPIASKVSIKRPNCVFVQICGDRKSRNGKKSEKCNRRGD